MSADRDAAILRGAYSRGYLPDPALTVTEWSDLHRRLPSASASEPGRFDSARTPYMREIMDALTLSHPCADLALIKGTQIGGSEAMYNTIFYAADMAPSPILMVMPTIDFARKVSRQRLQPSIDATPRLAARFSKPRSRTHSNTALLKEFVGGMLLLVGANSASGLRGMPARVVLQDEIDAFTGDAGGEGDPCVIADKRSDTFLRAKRVKCSTPKIKGSSRIDHYYRAGTQARYHVACPHCDELLWLRWPQMRWRVDDDGTVESVWYDCEHCGAAIDESAKPAMMREWPAGRARHVHDRPGRGAVLADDDPHPHALWARIDDRIVRYLPEFDRPLSWHVSALYSPLGWYSWTSAVEDWIRAQTDEYDESSGESLAQVFANTVLGEAYTLPGEAPETNAIRKRAEAYDQGMLPAVPVLLVGAVDVQGDRLEVQIEAFGEGEESWVIDWQVIAGDPSKQGAGSVWEALAQLRAKTYRHPDGRTIGLSAMAIDSGYLTQDVYDFCREHARRHVIATKGFMRAGAPVLSRANRADVDQRGMYVRRGVQLRHIGVDTIKERLFRRLAIETPGPCYQHFPRWLPAEYFDQLASEKLVTRRVRGREKRTWEKTRERNEALDLKILAYAAAVHAGLQRVDWRRLRAHQPQVAEQEASEQPHEQEAVTAPTPPRSRRSPWGRTARPYIGW